MYPNAGEAPVYRILNNSNGLDFEAMRLDPLSKLHFLAVARDVGQNNLDMTTSLRKKNRLETCAGQERVSRRRCR